MAGFSLHAGVAVKACQRDKLERLCRYICSPPISEKRLCLASRREIGYTLKTPYRDGTTHVIFELHRPAGGTGATAAPEPDPFPWGQYLVVLNLLSLKALSLLT